MPWPKGTHRPVSQVWLRTRALVKARSQGRCEVQAEGLVCGVLGTQVDHIIPVAEGGTDHVSNAQMICDSHHRDKTQAEAQRGAERKRNKGKRSPEPHPFDLM